MDTNTQDLIPNISKLSQEPSPDPKRSILSLSAKRLRDDFLNLNEEKINEIIEHRFKKSFYTKEIEPLLNFFKAMYLDSEIRIRQFIDNSTLDHNLFNTANRLLASFISIAQKQCGTDLGINIDLNYIANKNYIDRINAKDLNTYINKSTLSIINDDVLQIAPQYQHSIDHGSILLIHFKLDDLKTIVQLDIGNLFALSDIPLCSMNTMYQSYDPCNNSPINENLSPSKGSS
jgi:hypothetical protein